MQQDTVFYVCVYVYCVFYTIIQNENALVSNVTKCNLSTCFLQRSYFLPKFSKTVIFVHKHSCLLFMLSAFLGAS